MDLAEDCQGLTVQSVPFAPGGGPVFYASLPYGRVGADKTREGCGTNGAEDKHRLVSALWDHTVTRESPLWKRCQVSNGTGWPIQVACGLLGRPYLLLGEYRGPSVSFSEGGGKLWAALCGDESSIGIDVAGCDEFQGEYPFQRVFQPQELQQALRVADGAWEEAGALLWSIKEAVVKALGCAFHLLDPRQITVYLSAGETVGGDGGYIFPVGLSGKALERFPRAADRSLRVRSLPRAKGWLSIALLNRRHR